MKISAFLSLVLIFSEASAIHGCYDTEKFHTKFATSLKGGKLETVFRTGAFLGKGSFGEVRKISWVPVAEPGAHLPGDLASSTHAAAKKVAVPYDRFEIMVQETEIKHMTELKGTGASVEYFGCMEGRANLFLVQEMLFKDLDSGTVASGIKGMRSGERLAIYKQLANKFKVMHDHSITHQDIKPANIMAKDSGLKDYRIIDLGLSVKVGGSVLGGTPLYNSPDKIRSSPRASTFHDVWALSLTFAALEGSEDSLFRGITASCVKLNFDYTCISTLKRNINSDLTRSGQTGLIGIINSVIDSTSRTRITTMEQLAAEITKIMPVGVKKEEDKPIAEENFQDLLRSRNNARELAKKDPVRAFEAEKDWKKKQPGYEENKGLYEKQVIREIPQAPVEQPKPVVVEKDPFLARIDAQIEERKKFMDKVEKELNENKVNVENAFKKKQEVPYVSPYGQKYGGVVQQKPKEVYQAPKYGGYGIKQEPTTRPVAVGYGAKKPLEFGAKKPTYKELAGGYRLPSYKRYDGAQKKLVPVGQVAEKEPVNKVPDGYVPRYRGGYYGGIHRLIV